MSEKRPYVMRKRAESQDETRQRIIDATMQLHEEVGPRATTISAIAERAGVQRLTVYRHFPDETAVFQACTSHWLSLNPPPDPAAWGGIADPLQRARAALSAFYAYYDATQRMWTAAYRDETDVPALQGPMAEFRAYVANVGDDLAKQLASGNKPTKQLVATARHALDFSTWSSLKGAGLSDDSMTELVCSWIGCVAGGNK